MTSGPVADGGARAFGQGSSGTTLFSAWPQSVSPEKASGQAGFLSGRQTIEKWFVEIFFKFRRGLLFSAFDDCGTILFRSLAAGGQ
jgi:hypothetical protein